MGSGTVELDLRESRNGWIIYERDHHGRLNDVPDPAPGPSKCTVFASLVGLTLECWARRFVKELLNCHWSLSG